jgi:hypothetical protein
MPEHGGREAADFVEPVERPHFGARRSGESQRIQ